MLDDITLYMLVLKLNVGQPTGDLDLNLQV